MKNGPVKTESMGESDVEEEEEARGRLQRVVDGVVDERRAQFGAHREVAGARVTLQQRQ